MGNVCKANIDNPAVYQSKDRPISATIVSKRVFM